jgi:hypothetical protein
MREGREGFGGVRARDALLGSEEVGAIVSDEVTPASSADFPQHARRIVSGCVRAVRERMWWRQKAGGSVRTRQRGDFCWERCRFPTAREPSAPSLLQKLPKKNEARFMWFMIGRHQGGQAQARGVRGRGPLSHSNGYLPERCTGMGSRFEDC